MASDHALDCERNSVSGNFMFETATHGDFLGSILGTGVTRDKVGDIIIQVSVSYVCEVQPLSCFPLFVLEVCKDHREQWILIFYDTLNNGHNVITCGVRCFIAWKL